MPDPDRLAPKAYSYLRFSTPEQEQGDSFRRQLKLAEEYAERKGLELDQTLKLHDRGVSAFRGRNAEVGKLGKFLEAVASGEVKEGSYLLVENLDRISRQSARKALRKLGAICDAGITVVTLTDEREYTSEALDDNPMALMLSLLTFIRANEESKIKARRLRSAWEEKREKARKTGKPVTARTPAWLTLNEETDEIEVIEERAEIIRRIYRETLDGEGTTAITKGLNEDRVPTFGRADHWSRSYIHKILKNEAVIGTYTPHTHEYEDGKAVRKALEPIEGYFPAVVDEDTYYSVRALKKASKAPMRGKNAHKMIYNIFGGIAQCDRCEGTVTYVNKGRNTSGHGKYLVCRAAKEGAGCEYRSVPYHEVEEAFLENRERIFGEAPANEEGSRMQQELEVVELLLEDTAEEIENLVNLAQHRESVAVARRIRELEAKRDELKGRRDELRETVATTAGPMVDRRIDDLDEALSAEPMDRKRVNTLMRQVFDGIVIDRNHGVLLFQWHQGGETDLQFRWPESDS